MSSSPLTCCLGRKIRNEFTQEVYNSYGLQGSFFVSGMRHIKYGLYFHFFRLHPICRDIVFQTVISVTPNWHFFLFSFNPLFAGVFSTSHRVVNMYFPRLLSHQCTLLCLPNSTLQNLYYGFHGPVKGFWCRHDAKWEPQKTVTPSLHLSSPWFLLGIW